MTREGVTRGLLTRGLALAAVLAAPVAARAETHSLPIRNGSGEVVTGVFMSAPGSGTAGSGTAGSNRLRSQLPPGAEGSFGYSTGCRADVRIAYAGGRSEDHADVDICGGARVVAGQDGVAGPAVAAVGSSAGPPPAAAKAVGGKAAIPAAATPAAVVRAPPPVVPPWTGKSITKRFGGME